MKCVMCNRQIKGNGNNAEPVAKGECCNDCNYELVVPARIKQMASMMGSLGGKASAKKLSKEQRKERAKKAIQARWNKRKNMYKIKKLGVGRYSFYQVVDSKGDVIKEFDAYNYQKPFMQAKNYIKELETKTA